MTIGCTFFGCQLAEIHIDAVRLGGRDTPEFYALHVRDEEHGVPMSILLSPAQAAAFGALVTDGLAAATATGRGKQIYLSREATTASTGTDAGAGL